MHAYLITSLISHGVWFHETGFTWLILASQYLSRPFVHRSLPLSSLAVHHSHKLHRPCHHYCLHPLEPLSCSIYTSPSLVTACGVRVRLRLWLCRGGEMRWSRRRLGRGDEMTLIGVDSIAGRPASGDVFSQSMHQVGNSYLFLFCWGCFRLIVHNVFGFVDPNVVSSSLLPQSLWWSFFNLRVLDLISFLMNRKCQRAFFFYFIISSSSNQRNEGLEVWLSRWRGIWFLCA
jgi:hypothetical protein